MRLKMTVWAMTAFLALSCAQQTDILIVGGGASGTAAGIQAARMGVKTLVAEESTWLGGMLTAAGVSAIDGNYRLRSGIYDEFVDSLAAHYGGLEALRTGWVSNVLFEPHVGDRVLKNIAAGAGPLTLWYDTAFESAKKTGDGWKVTLRTGSKRRTVHARVLIDGTELGDVAKAVGVPYSIGMDARSETGENIAPEQANDIIQDLTFCLTLTDYGPDADKTIPKPEPYHPELYYNCAVNAHNVNTEGVPGQSGYRKADTKQPLWSPSMMLNYGKLPVTRGGAKYMVNWPVDANDVYVNIIDATPERRKAALDSCKNISLGFLYFCQTELGYKNLGLSEDEYPTPDLLPFIPYHRESRRIDGVVRFTVDDAAHPFRNNLYRTGLGSGTYPVDHHHYRNARWMDLPKLYFYPIPSFNLPAGVVLPKEVDDFLVAEKSVSVTNIVNGTTRLQPVVLQIGQACGALAALSVLCDKPVREIPVRDLQDQLLAAGVYIMPYNDLDNSDPRFAAVQRIGATGILRGDGKPFNWENQTWFRVDDPLKVDEVYLSDYYGDNIGIEGDNAGIVSMQDALNLVSVLSGRTLGPDELVGLGIHAIDLERPVTRCEFCVLLDAAADPFHRFPVDWAGNLVR
ncbi:MAG: FAD-dependent oxidoreductase [Bacteroidales bacterium]|nr:FAD-dependent oxidoreductase [Bacteroidales bacterium]